ncbi:right-handed parallel beta-helix repeat-containing protein [Methanothermobacter sp. KEPCO-1]|uniref:right-handed parallel beta-helix repeat-containing protein n=1 Tax=Methanothermobacter sp. KEPCO-1 TaxID=2603820 RepID=UPI0011CAC632|nr:right-handed parallel beta-helix repeat-containing protein [Methanothermobacter sp. KEPCO-1]QEF93787.1 right-handed parallel beta-helix repeat-containing protein [Methanothermobacter sp. KEPCO-1]
MDCRSSGGYNFTSIQAAIDNGSTVSGDTIIVHDDGGNPYTYHESVTVNKTNLTIRSAGLVTVNGSLNPSSPVFRVQSTGSGATIQGFRLVGATAAAGVSMDGAENVTLTNLNITGSSLGVLIRGESSNVTVSGVTVNRTSQQGLYVDGGASVSGLVVRDSVFDSTGASGIGKDYSSSVDVLRLENVTVVNATGYGVLLNARSYYGYFVRNVVVNNTTIRDCSQDGLRITMETNSENATIINVTSTNNRGSGLYAELRGNNTLENSTFSNNTNWGIWLTGQNNPKLTFQRNNAYNNSAGGIYLRNINNVTINGSESIIKDNGGTCLELQNADGVTVEGLVFGNGVRQFNYGVVAVDCDDLILRGLSIGNSTLQGVRVGGMASNVTLVGVNVTGSGQQGLLLVESSTLRNVTVDDSWFVNCSEGIRRVSWSWDGFLMV